MMSMQNGEAKNMAFYVRVAHERNSYTCVARTHPMLHSGRLLRMTTSSVGKVGLAELKDSATGIDCRTARNPASEAALCSSGQS